MRALPFFILTNRTACRPVSPMRELHQLTAPFHPDQLSSPFHSCARCIRREFCDRCRRACSQSILPREMHPDIADQRALRVAPNPYFRARCISTIGGTRHVSLLPIHTSARDASCARHHHLAVVALPIHTSARDASANISKKWTVCTEYTYIIIPYRVLCGIALSKRICTLLHFSI